MANTKRNREHNSIFLVTDVRNDTRKRSIYGLVAYSWGEMYIVASCDTSSTRKSTNLLDTNWIVAIETIGAMLIVGFIADGELTNNVAGQIIEGFYPYIMVSFYMDYYLNNLLKDIGKLSWIEFIIESVAYNVTFFNDHTFFAFSLNRDRKRFFANTSTLASPTTPSCCIV